MDFSVASTLACTITALYPRTYILKCICFQVSFRRPAGIPRFVSQNISVCCKLISSGNSPLIITGLSTCPYEYYTSKWLGCTCPDLLWMWENRWALRVLHGPWGLMLVRSLSSHCSHPVLKLPSGAPSQYVLTVDQSGIRWAFSSLPEVGHACFWIPTTAVLSQQWYNQANAESVM